MLCHVRLNNFLLRFVAKLSVVNWTHSHDTTFLSNHRAMIFAYWYLIECVLAGGEHGGLVQILCVSLTICCEHAAVSDWAPGVKFAVFVNCCRYVALSSDKFDFLILKILDLLWDLRSELLQANSELTSDALTPRVNSIRFIGICVCESLFVHQAVACDSWNANE